MVKKSTLLKLVAVGAYVLMVTVNALANILPINNINTGKVSDAYPNLFAPAGLTFSIWGVIYLLLGGYLIYQFGAKKINQKLSASVNILFAISSVVNSAWIFAWHYRLIGLSVVLMLVLLTTLIKIADLLNEKSLTAREKLIYKVPFGIYFGWITVATIANITTFLVSVGWNGFGWPDTAWMMIVLLAGVGIATVRMHIDRNLAYGLVPVWAYWGIWFKHTSASGFNYAYPAVITTTMICIGLLLLANTILVVRKKVL